MVSLKDFFNKSVFVKGLDHPFSPNIAPTPDLSSLSEEEMNNIKYGMYKFNEFKETSTAFSSLISGYLKAFEKNNNRRITDDILFKSLITIEDVDLVKVETEVRVDRVVEGEMHDKASVRDAMFPIGYNDGGYQFIFTEFYVLIDDGKKMLHYTDFSDSVEVFELNVQGNLMSGFKISDLTVFNETDLDRDEPLINEIKSVIKGKKDILELIKR